MDDMGQTGQTGEVDFEEDGDFWVFTPGYFKDSGTGNSAQQKALYQCLSSSQQAIAFDCTGNGGEHIPTDIPLNK